MDEQEEFEFRARAEREAATSKAPQQPAPTIGKRTKGVGEVAAQLGSGMFSQPLAGYVGLTLGTDAEGGAAGQEGLPSVAERAQAVEGVQQALTYQPQTAEGQRYAGTIAKPFERLAGYADTAGQKTLEATGSPAAAAGVRTLIEGAPTLAPGIPKGVRAIARPLREAVAPVAAKIASRREGAVAVQAAEQAPKNVAIERARSQGLKIPPSEVSGAPVGKALEGIGGKVQTEMSFSRANAKVINRQAGKAIGLSERQSLTPANLERLKSQAISVYDRVRGAGKIKADEGFKSELEQVRDRTGQEASDYPEDVNESIEKEIAKFDKPEADASSMLSKIKKLRERASRNMAGDADKFELGVAQKKIATAMENLIERQVSGTGLIRDFRAARTQLAKIYNVEEALSPNGNVSAAVLARQMKRGVPLSGELKDLASSYLEFPKVMRYVDNLGGHAPFSALDYLVGGVEAVAHPAGAARIVGALATRPVARAVIKSEPYQRAAIKAREPKPSVVSRTARRIAGPRTLKEERGYLTQERE